MGTAIRIVKEHGVCPDCEQPVADGAVLSDSLFIAKARHAGTLLVLGHKGAAHLHGVTVMPRGEERLLPTLRRAASTARRQAKWAVRRHRVRLVVGGVALAAALAKHKQASRPSP